MLSFFTDPISLAILLTALAGVVSVIIAIVQMIRSRARKELTYKVLSNASLVNAMAQSAVQVSLRDKTVPCGTPINDADLLVLSVKNTGDTNIIAGNYVNQRPIGFSFSDREVISVTDVRTEPEADHFSQEQVQASKGRPGYITLDRPELNKNTSVILSILLSRRESVITADFKATGSSHTKPQKEFREGLCSLEWELL